MEGWNQRTIFDILFALAVMRSTDLLHKKTDIGIVRYFMFLRIIIIIRRESSFFATSLLVCDSGVVFQQRAQGMQEESFVSVSFF